MNPDPPVDPFVSTLHDLISVCTDILDMSPSALTSKPGMGADLVRKVQEVGRAWDAHPDWYGRTWYITVLLAVATLARVVEWFEAERQFWNFEDDDAEGEIEALTFVLKPESEMGFKNGHESRERDDSMPRTPLAPSSVLDENPLRLSRDTSLVQLHHESRRSRDERVPQKDLRGSMLIGDQGLPSPSPAMTERPAPQPSPVPSTQTLQAPSPGQQPGASEGQNPSDGTVVASESMRVEAGEHLRQKADKAKTSNILMELNLDGEHFLYINRNWYDVIGYVAYSRWVLFLGR